MLPDFNTWYGLIGTGISLYRQGNPIPITDVTASELVVTVGSNESRQLKVQPAPFNHTLSLLPPPHGSQIQE